MQTALKVNPVSTILLWFLSVKLNHPVSVDCCQSIYSFYCHDGIHYQHISRLVENNLIEVVHPPHSFVTLTIDSSSRNIRHTVCILHGLQYRCIVPKNNKEHWRVIWTRKSEIDFNSWQYGRNVKDLYTNTY